MNVPLVACEANQPERKICIPSDPALLPKVHSLESFCAMAAAKMSAQFKVGFQRVLNDAKTMKANEAFQACMELLKEHKLLYTIKELECKFLLTHKENRGGLMLSPHNAHRNAAKIHMCGADMKQLTNAVCIEIAPAGHARAQQIAANEKLIQRPSACWRH